jgi:hypothetical protein
VVEHKEHHRLVGGPTPRVRVVVVVDVVVKTVVVALILIKGVGTMCPIFLRHFPYYLLLEMMNRMR